MTWEERLLDLFEDLEQQAEGAALAARDAEVAELARAEYSEVDLDSRWHASVGREIQVAAVHGLVVRGRVARVGDGWCLVARSSDGAEGDREWILALRAVVAVRGLSPQARTEPLRPVTGRLGLGSALRGIAEERAAVTVVRGDGTHRRGRLGRVGRDFVELQADDGATEAVPFSAVVAVVR